MMLTVLPLIDVPDFTALFVVNTPMNDGMPDSGGGGLAMVPDAPRPSHRRLTPGGKPR